MKLRKNFLDKIPFYPLLFGIYPVLFLWMENYIQIHSFVVLRSLIIAIGITCFFCLISLVVMRDIQKSGLLAGLLLVMFFFYGQFFDLVKGVEIFGFTIGKHRFILPFWGLISAGCVFFIFRIKSGLQNLTRAFNLVTSILVVLILGQLAYKMLNNMPSESIDSIQVSAAQAVSALQTPYTNTPDVYYILLDGYDREDILKSVYHFDNQEFIRELKALGFVVPDCTQSNYNGTVTALASTLNMDYIDQIGLPNLEWAKMNQNTYTAVLTPKIRKNRVMKLFKEMGYQIITLKTPYPFIDFPSSDIVYDTNSPSEPLVSVEALNFQDLFLRTTLIRVIMEKTVVSPEKFHNVPPGIMQFLNPNLIHNKKGSGYQVYEQHLYQLEKLENLARVPGKKFLYAHLLITHSPFVYTPTGELLTQMGDPADDYISSVKYANEHILTIVKNLIAQSKIPPIIILQGDHGKVIDKKSNDIYKILNAYYLPDKGKDKIYPNITPVNTFRVILTEYFNQDFPLLPDQSVVRTQKNQNGYRVVPQTCVK